MQPIRNLLPDLSSKPPTSPASPTSDAPGWRPTLEERDESLVRAADACAHFVADVARGADPYWLTLSGVPGNGKTLLTSQTHVAARKHCAAATANHPMQSGVYDERNRRPDCRWIDESTFARLIFDDHQWDLPEHLSHEWLVCYDDLGAKTFMTAAARDGFVDALFRLANRRLGKWTLWSTNFTMTEIAKRLDGRIASRLIRDSNRLVTITAGDYATRKKP